MTEDLNLPTIQNFHGVRLVDAEVIRQSVKIIKQALYHLTIGKEGYVHQYIDQLEAMIKFLDESGR